jgi:hypothetical protein
MAHIPNPESQGLTFTKYRDRINVLEDLVKYETEVIEKYLQMTQELVAWNAFFNPTITIIEVNNKNMGHIYMGKIRVPVAMSKKQGTNKKPMPHVITFVVGKYSEYPGDKFKQEREEKAYLIAMEKLAKNYPERFSKLPDEIDYKLVIKARTIKEFQDKWSMPY